MKKTKKIKWAHYFSRKFCAQRFEILPRVFGSSFFFKHFGQRIQHVLIIPERGNHTICYNEDEWLPFISRVFRVVCKNLKNFRKYMSLVARRQVQYAQEATKLASGNLKRKSWLDLKKLYIKFDKLHLDFFIGPIWIPFITEPIIAEIAEKELHKLLKKSRKADRFNNYFDIIFSPENKNAIIQEHEDLLKIALKYKKRAINKSQLERFIKRHVKRFEWLPCYDINDKPWDKSYFSKELKKLLVRSAEELHLELTQINKNIKYRKREFRRILKEVKPSLRQRELFIMAHEMSFIKDERDDYRRRGSYNIQPLYHEMARRVGVNIKEITQLIRAEMLDFLTKGKLPVSKSVLKSRVNGYILLRKFGQPIVVSQGQAMKKMVRQELGVKKISKEKIVKGTVGSRGKTSGSVQVIYTKHDLRKVKEGDIMIAVTTHPDFVPAMRKCKAIVTDEGGITCHAAIVSRELKIPCVIGTKIATKVFKDGDLVEVDASKGMVKKIK